MADQAYEPKRCFTSEPHPAHRTVFAPETGIDNFDCPGVDRERRRAADLRTGDRFIPGDLVGADIVEEVLGVHPFPDTSGVPCVMVVTRPDGREQVFSQYWTADASLALAADSGTVVPEGVAGQAVGRASVHTAESPWECRGCGSDNHGGGRCAHCGAGRDAE